MPSPTMRRRVDWLLVALLLCGAACETPDESEPSGERRETQSREKSSGVHSVESSGSARGSFGFESAPAADSGEREALLYAVPDDPRAILWVFHGRGDAREICRRHHLVPAMRAFFREGFAVVCPQSLDRREKAWAGGTVEQAGPDVGNIRRVRAFLRSEGHLPDGLPEFGWGISNGGGFVGTWAYHELAEGVDIRGIECMIASCRSAVKAGEEFGLYIHWAAAKKDPFFPFESVRDTYESYDGPKSFAVADPAALTTSILEEFTGLSATAAGEIREALESDELLGADGVPSCDPKSSSGCRRRLGDAYRSAGPEAPRSLVRHVYENCRATHMAFHRTCDGDDNTSTVLEEFQGEL